MAIGGLIILMILAIVLGKRAQRLGTREYITIAFITLAQVCLLGYYLYTIGLPTLN